VRGISFEAPVFLEGLHALGEDRSNAYQPMQERDGTR